MFDKFLQRLIDGVFLNALDLVITCLIFLLIFTVVFILLSKVMSFFLRNDYDMSDRELRAIREFNELYSLPEQPQKNTPINRKIVVKKHSLTPADQRRETLVVSDQTLSAIGDAINDFQRNNLN